MIARCRTLARAIFLVRRRGGIQRRSLGFPMRTADRAVAPATCGAQRTESISAGLVTDRRFSIQSSA
jgi:hypothetical protein